MRILFIDPAQQCISLNPGLALLSSVLLKKGHSVRVLDLNNTDLNRFYQGYTRRKMSRVDFNEIEEQIKTYKPSVIGLPVLNTTIEETHKTISFIRHRFPNLRIMIGGPQTSWDVEQLLEFGPDLAVIGEAEETIIDVMKYFEDKLSLDQIDGIAYKDEEGKTITNPKRKLVTDLEALPYANYDVFTSVMKNNGKIKWYPISTSRGCPQSCTFCSVHLTAGRKWRYRSAESVINEIELAKKKHHIDEICVTDPAFLRDKDRAIKICDGMRQNYVKGVALAGLRADKIDQEMASNLSVFPYVGMGIESADPLVLERTKKGESIEQIQNAIKLLKAEGIRVCGFFIIGLPGSSYEKDMKSLDFVKDNKMDYAEWFLCTLYPGTEIRKWAKEHGRMLDDSNCFNYGTLSKRNTVPFDTPDYPAKRRLEVYHKCQISVNNFERLYYCDNQLKRYLKRSYLAFKYNKLRDYHSYLRKEFIRNIFNLPPWIFE